MARFRYESDDIEASGGKHKDPDEFIAQWPTETRGDGKIRPNNVRTGSAQGRGSIKRKAPCRQCGFILDTSRDDHSGGSLDGDGAGGAVTLLTETYTTSAGTSVTEYAGDQAHRMASGCPLCFSRNGTTENKPYDQTQPSGRAKPGF